MLILSRKRDERIMIGDNISVTVVEIRGDKVRLGIEAPTPTPVHREEVYLAIQRDGKISKASQPNGSAGVSSNEGDGSNE